MRKPFVLVALALPVAGLFAVTAAWVTTSPGLLALWHMDEGSGNTTFDTSGNSNNGTIHGATWTGGILSGSALDFDGVDDYMSVPHSPELNPSSAVSVEAWVKPDALNEAVRSILMKGTGEGVSWSYYLGLNTHPLTDDNQAKFKVFLGSHRN